MSAPALAVLHTGLVSSVGMSGPAACAAIRAGIANSTQTAFTDSTGAWIMGHQVPLERPWRGLSKLVEMAALAIEECLVGIARQQWDRVPLLLCVAEPERPGRLSGLDDELFERLCRRLGAGFAHDSSIVAHGRVSAAVALRQARALMQQGSFARVLITAADSLLVAQTLRTYERCERLLTPVNADGFIPGEGAAALLVGPAGHDSAFICSGLGLATETAHIESGQPLRADGLAQAIRTALNEAGCQMHELDFRITDISGEQYYFKEAALALSRVLRVRMEEFDLWHPAECIGESGAVTGLAGIIVAEAATRKRYAKGPNVLWHAAADGGYRAAAVLHSRA